MNVVSRRRCLQAGLAAGLAWPISAIAAADASTNSALPSRKFTMDLACGAIGVKADQREAIRLAAEHGFEAVDADSHFLAELDQAELDALLDDMKARNVVWGAAGLPVEFRQDENRFREDLRKFPRLAAALQTAGVTRVGTWLRPNHDELTYMQNFKQHARRLRECVKIMRDHGQRFGMEYVGPKTLWAGARHSFIHTMAETKDLIAEIGLDQVGFVLDSWHWYTAHETVDDLKTLSNADIVVCDLNDAPGGIAVDEQIDNRRELPAASGVINLSGFLNTLADIGYDGPIRAEPFNQPLNALDNEDATAATAAAMKKAFALVKSE